MASKPNTARQHKHFAVLIDADNAPAAIVEGLFEEIAKYGVASVKRIYGDWTQPNLGSWKKVLLDHSIQPIQQFAYTKGKNATDSSLIIDAMDLLYTRRFDGFCLVSSDSDFTRLAARLREEGLEVIGFGEQKTPQPFVKACDTFIYTELLRDDASEHENSAQPTPETLDTKPTSNPAPAVEAPKAETTPPKVPCKLISKVIDDISDEDGWAHMAVLGGNLRKLKSDFDPRLYGFKKLSDLIKARNGRFELQERGVTTTGGKELFVRNRKAAAKQ
ncbi:NYN domain-containing protein [Pseudomonas mendocina]|uniref:NYN domain-containing protein n=1 Tax=Ectopseudomonas mendocina TaxID=300 RepID=UPI0023D98315|nr:NYN domain-containing protein [Pseudomonas mendocina]MDF2075908.1 NYN domain-containing protein [Pseudomonas mendocina]